MPHCTDLTGLAGIASLMAALLLQLPHVRRLPKRFLAMLAAATFAASLIPIAGMPLAGYVRGMVGDLSFTTVVLAWAAILQPHCATMEGKHRQHLLMLVAATALIFYPMTLGMSLVDPYRLGYGNPVFVAVVLIVASAAWLLRHTPIALCLSLATLAWSLGWYESANLWDYLIDPLVAIYALGGLLRQGMNKSCACRPSNR